MVHYRDLMERTRRALGPSHPDFLRLELARLFYDEDSFRAKLTELRRIVGDLHPAVQTAMNDHGLRCLRNGYLDEAETLLSANLLAVFLKCSGFIILGRRYGSPGQYIATGSTLREIVDPP